MIRSRYQITLKGGRRVDLLFSLALFGIAKREGISLVMEDTGDVSERINFFLKVIYCGARTAWEYRSFDGGIGDFPYSFLDFAEWAADNPKEFAEIIRGASSAISGKELPEEPEDCVDDVKKKLNGA